MTELVHLNLFDCRYITDISFLSELTGLRELYLAGNQITDITPLRGLTSLEHVVIDAEQIADISPLFDLTSLRRLTVGRITSEQAEMLKSALPSCEIWYAVDDTFYIYFMGEIINEQPLS
jgi:hypothetical protein